MAVELATAYFTLLPSMKGTAAAVTSQLGAVEGAAVASGTRTGAALGGGLVAGFGKFIPILGGILAGAGIVQVFQDSTAAASDLNESTNAVKVTFGDLADEIGRLSSTAAGRLGLSQNQFNGFATQFSAFAGTIAGQGGDVVGVIDSLTQRGADFASVYNLDVADALILFQSGLAGETEPLRRYGIDISAAAVESYAYANGIAAAGAQLTEQQKVQARYGLLLASTSKTQGDFANTSDGLANSQRILAAKFEDARAKLGDALLPALTKLTQFGIEKGVPLFEKLVDLFIKLEPGISATADALLGLTGFYVDINFAAADFFETLANGNLTWQAAARILGELPAPLRDGIAGVANFIAGIVNSFLSGIESIVNGAANAINTVLASLGSAARAGTITLPKLGTVSFSGGTKRGVRMAEGALVTARPGGVAATVGEGRHNEAVIPLRPDVLAEIGAGIAASSSGGMNDRILGRILEALQQRQIIEADGVAIARTSSRGSASLAAIGAT